MKNRIAIIVNSYESHMDEPIPIFTILESGTTLIDGDRYAVLSAPEEDSYISEHWGFISQTIGYRVGYFKNWKYARITCPQNIF